MVMIQSHNYGRIFLIHFPSDPLVVSKCMNIICYKVKIDNENYKYPLVKEKMY